MKTSKLGKFCLAVFAVLLVSCMEDVRRDWDNPDDPDSRSWSAHKLIILDRFFSDVDTLFAAPGDTFRLHPGFCPRASSLSRSVAWSARNISTAEKRVFQPDPTDQAEGVDVALAKGTWMLRLEDPDPVGGIFEPDSIVIVVGTQDQPAARRRGDTVIFCRLPLGGKDTIGLFATDPFDRHLSYKIAMEGRMYDSRIVDLSKFNSYGTFRVDWGVENSVGLADTSSFTVTLRPDTIMDHGISYRVAPFGTQVWMIDNLRRDTANGTGSWCYESDPANCAKYGRLYDWATATAGHVSKDTPNVQDQPLRGICPQGWHIPTFVDMMTLKAWLKRPDVLYVPDELVGRAMESDSLWKPFWSDSKYRGASGFNLLPGGFYDTPNGKFLHMGAHADFWTSQHWGTDSARIMAVFENHFFAATDTTNEKISQAGNLMYIEVSQKYGMPVRCLQN